jgi:ribose transport system substrate-binding protein
VFLAAGLLVTQTGAGRLHAAAKKKPDKIVIGWTPPDITGVFKTATDYFEKSAEDATAYGIDVEVISQSPATHVAFADQVAIIEDYGSGR